MRSMAGMRTVLRPVFTRHETTTGPVAFGGRTITLVARTTALHVGDTSGALHLRARPVHVEVLDGEGRVLGAAAKVETNPAWSDACWLSRAGLVSTASSLQET